MLREKTGSVEFQLNRGQTGHSRDRIDKYCMLRYIACRLHNM